MCDNQRFGSCLEHGSAHREDHRRWTRREFLFGMSAAGTTLLLGSTPVQAFSQAPLLRMLGKLETQRALVLIQLNGGNDGLNTIVPVEDDLYYTRRPTLAIQKSTTIALNDQLGMHPSLVPVEDLFSDGKMSIVQNVGYESPNLSHFRSTDIWASASGSGEVISTGWTGRMLDTLHPEFEASPPAYPLAVQIGGGSSMLFQGAQGNMGMSLLSTDLFDRIAAGGTLYNPAAVPDTSYGDEIAFVRTVANNAFRYSDIIQEASEAGRNKVDYPANPLADSLAIVAQLIKGRLGSKIYLVSMSGFDTHANQLGVHSGLLHDLAEAVGAFQSDLEADALGGEVLVMTFSEFGRRVQQNGSSGTDHGTAAPLFLFGGGLNGGVYGTAPNLDDLDGTGNLKYETDFRAVYATILADWFGLEAGTVADVLGGTHDNLGFVADPTSTGTQKNELPDEIRLEQNYPNPFNPQTVIAYSLPAQSHVRLSVFDVNGRLVQRLVDREQPAGRHEVRFDGGRLSSGVYLYRLETPRATKSGSMTLAR